MKKVKHRLWKRNLEILKARYENPDLSDKDIATLLDLSYWQVRNVVTDFRNSGLTGLVNVAPRFRQEAAPAATTAPTWPGHGRGSPPYPPIKFNDAPEAVGEAMEAELVELGALARALAPVASERRATGASGLGSGPHKPPRKRTRPFRKYPEGLTEEIVQNPRLKPGAHGDGAGLMLYVSYKRGHEKTWKFRWVEKLPDGRPHWHQVELGLVSRGVGLKEARRLATRMRAVLARGQRPRDVMRMSGLAHSPNPTPTTAPPASTVTQTQTPGHGFWRSLLDPFKT